MADNDNNDNDNKDKEKFADFVRKGKVPMQPDRSDKGGGSASPGAAGQAGIPRQLLPAGNAPGAHVAPARYRKPGFADKDLGKLTSAGASASYDYHELTSDQARQQLEQDLRGALEEGHTEVEFIHGKGSGILKRNVRYWLENSPAVVAYVEPAGNSGCVIARLKSF